MSTFSVIKDSSTINTVRRCYRATGTVINISAAVGDPIEQVLMYKTIGGAPTLYYEKWENIMYNTVYYEALEDGTVTGVKPIIGSEVFPCEIQNNTAQLAYMKTEDTSIYVTYDMGDYPSNYTLS